MIIDSLLEIIIDFFVGLFNLLHIPDVPQPLVNIKNMYDTILRNYVMPIMNFLFGHAACSWVMVITITLFNLWIDYKLFVWIYDKVRGGSSE